MSDKLPIEYARAESADVVRKKFRRRVVMFVIATVVVMVVGLGWDLTTGELVGSSSTNLPVTVESYYGKVFLTGPTRMIPLYDERPSMWKYYGSQSVGITFTWYDIDRYPKWQAGIRYRTLFTLAMIPWIITLIRMIRVWKRKRVFETEPRTQ